MNRIIVSVGGRAPARCAAVAACGDRSGGKKCRCFAQDLIGLRQLTHVSFQNFHLPDLLARDTAALTPIHFDLLEPII
ncbi:hypothetical protein [uncultured Tateyamaria sp.]|uniref:hypothetical protein n=1 Tax=uncultured Tateyamaria sp. TaxID=455651 RepID=UPI00261F3EBF|nr:hypothetical protein [uncultured Tateyamaria sp.]